MQQYQALKDQHRNTRDGMPEALNLRIHRALSWLNRAEQCEDTDGRFVFLWIAFNAAYAQEIPHNVLLSEQESFRSFLHKLHQLDRSKRLDALVWKEFSGPIRVLLDNPYVFESFWEYQRGNITENQWKERLASGKTARGALRLNRRARWRFHRMDLMADQPRGGRPANLLTKQQMAILQ